MFVFLQNMKQTVREFIVTFTSHSRNSPNGRILHRAKQARNWIKMPGGSDSYMVCRQSYAMLTYHIIMPMVYLFSCIPALRCVLTFQVFDRHCQVLTGF